MHGRLPSSGGGGPRLPCGCTVPLGFHFPLLESENGADFHTEFPELNKGIHVEYLICWLKKKKKAAVKSSIFSCSSGTNWPQAREFHFGFQTSPTEKIKAIKYFLPPPTSGHNHVHETLNSNSGNGRSLKSVNSALICMSAANLWSRSDPSNVQIRIKQWLYRDSSS